MITNEQKHYLIDTAQELYRKCYSIRFQDDPFASEVNLTTFKNACRDMSILVHYLAKTEYAIVDEDNEIFHCEFSYNNTVNSHYFNKICGQIVDSTIMQFGNLSPYDACDNCYTKLKKEMITSDSYQVVKNEIDLYEVRKLFENRNNNRIIDEKTPNILQKFINRIWKKK